ncbi:carbamoyltransferase family protein [Salinibius halmophilus]|uniref:carbamoyltransferase family protein n=1 Tax=Salinibius halmophilus TaxID=1853216 RepID=UPI000E6764F9|nr:carbamoyltransferase C-terminal domain-containing protein [Salinibius halmophilus]
MYLGISCTGHDNALALVDKNGKVLYAQAAERDTQSKQGFSLAPDQPHKLAKLLKRYAPDITELTICKSWPADTEARMRAQIERITPVAQPGPEQAITQNFITIQTMNMEQVFLPNIQMAGGGAARTAFNLEIPSTIKHFDHHSTHAAFACYSSPFEEAACLVMDGYAEDSAQSVYIYKDNKLEKLDMPEYDGELNRIAASLGIYYGYTICKVCGFAPDSGEEWKIMGLAPYGKLNEAFLQVLREHIGVKDGYITLPKGSVMAVAKMREHARPYHMFPEECADLAYTAQYHFSELMDQVLTDIHRITGMDNIVITGGCGLNSSYNGRVTKNTPFKNIFVPNAPGDDGNAVGAALLAAKADNPDLVIRNAFQTPYLGDDIDEQEVASFIAKGGITNVEKLEWRELYQAVADELEAGKVVAWVQGRAEFGPRALGNRSILADPRSEKMKAKINAAVKYREPFRPFAPMVLDEFGEQYFEDYSDTPYMEKVLTFKPEVRGKVQAVCHADHTGRLQSVTKARNEHIHGLMTAFYERTGVPVLLNTSLNVMGKPIVGCLNDAVMTFYTSDIEVLVVGRYVFRKQAIKQGNEEVHQTTATV